MKKRRRRLMTVRIVMLAALVMVLVLLVVMIGRITDRSSETEHEVQSTVSSQEDGAALAEPESSTAVSEPEETEQILTLTEEQKHAGDLILVNSEYAYDFDANADTVDLVNILEQQSVSYAVDKEEFQISSHVLPHLDEMIAACGSAVGYDDTSISSAYRSKEYQQNLWDETVADYGSDYAEQYVSVPGSSEHHTGLAVDLGITNADGTLSSFSESNNAVWMNEHSWEYGFIRRYTEDKTEVTGISNESWHFRYVGYPHARYMKEQNLALEEYLQYLHDETDPEHPLTVTGNDTTWSIYFTEAEQITRPEGDFEISGNNMDGYIITEVVS